MPLASKDLIKKIATMLRRVELFDERASLVHAITKGRTNRLSLVEHKEALDIIQHLDAMFNPDADKCQRMRRKLMALAHDLQWYDPKGQVEIRRIQQWIDTRGCVRKPWMQLSVQELTRLVTQFEKMYADHFNRVQHRRITSATVSNTGLPSSSVAAFNA